MKRLLFLAMIFFLARCMTTANPTHTNSGSSVIEEAAWETPSLGVLVDERLKVAWVIPESAADKAGVKIGDVLVELRLTADDAMSATVLAPPVAEAGMPVVEETTQVKEGATPVTGEDYVPRGTVEPYLKDPIPFTDKYAIAQLLKQTMVLKEVTPEPWGPMNYKPESGPFILKIQRGNEILDLQITAENPRWIREGEPTPTPVPLSLQYF